MTGRLVGIARHARSRGPIEMLDAISVSIEGGLQGDFRGAIRPGGKGKRQVSMMQAESWAEAMAALGTDLDWSVRRVNLLSTGLCLPRATGTRLHIGDVIIEMTCECNPCSRMEEIAPGLRAALTPDWRGGILGRVITAGHIAVGNTIRIEEVA